MSNSQFAFLNKSDVPDLDALQNSIDKLGFDLQLCKDFTPFEDEGFLPCTLEGDNDTGFEIFYETVDEVCDDDGEEDEELRLIAKDKDYCIVMCWGGSMKDCACVMIVSCALSKDFGAIVSYEGYEPDSLEQMLLDTKNILIESKKEE